MAPNQENLSKSSLGIKYPSLRDHPLKTPEIWLEGKRIDDKVEKGLWRIHDDLYDFGDFVKRHPGGKDWLELTKGTDITEAFESHHLFGKAEKLLSKYHVKKTDSKRQSPFTFNENGFYRTLKRNIVQELEKIPENHSHKSKLFSDTLLVSCLAVSLLANSIQSYYFCGTLAAFLLALLAISAHNFFHQKDNFRMYYFDLTLMSSKSWRISHALSHHLYPNTINDLEITTLEPFLQYLPKKKTFAARYISWIYSPLFYSIIYIGSYVRMAIQLFRDKTLPRKESLLPICYLLTLYVGTNSDFLSSLKMFLYIQFISSFFFGLIGLNGAHHHPDIFHDGDASRSKNNLDWGIHQLDAVMDREEIIGSHFWVLVTFGDHGLHHLFPTIDHGKLFYLYPVFQKVCKQFGVELRFVSTLGLTIGQFKQLAKTEPNKIPPK